MFAYEKRNCGGDDERFVTGTQHMNDLTKLGLNDVISLVRKCRPGARGETTLEFNFNAYLIWVKNTFDAET